jgi:hypothetical protein
MFLSFSRSLCLFRLANCVTILRGHVNLQKLVANVLCFTVVFFPLCHVFHQTQAYMGG